MSKRPILEYDFIYAQCDICDGMVPPHLEADRMCAPCQRRRFGSSGEHHCAICEEPLLTTCDVNDLTHPRCRELGSIAPVNLSEAFPAKS
jgi:hypothetical protein